MLKKTITIVATLALLGGFAFADSATEYTNNDAEIVEGDPDYPYGGSSGLEVGYHSVAGDGSLHHNTLVGFDLSSYSGTTINSATLRLWVNGTYVGLPIEDVYIARNDDDWDEAVVTWNNAPGYLDSTPITTPNDWGVWWEIDVTDYVQDFVNGTYDNYGFHIYNTNEDYRSICMHSKEGSNDPELVIDYSSAIATTSLGEIKAVFE